MHKICGFSLWVCLPYCITHYGATRETKKERHQKWNFFFYFPILTNN